jgi:hypothetical protein
MFRFWVLTEGDLSMEIPDWIQDKARGLNIDFIGMNKFEVIRAIQAKEGNKPCYGNLLPGAKCLFADGCCWKKDCRGL